MVFYFSVFIWLCLAWLCVCVCVCAPYWADVTVRMNVLFLVVVNYMLTEMLINHLLICAIFAGGRTGHMKISIVDYNTKCGSKGQTKRARTHIRNILILANIIRMFVVCLSLSSSIDCFQIGINYVLQGICLTSLPHTNTHTFNWLTIIYYFMYAAHIVAIHSKNVLACHAFISMPAHS